VIDGFKQYELLLKKDNAIKVLDLAYHFTLVLFNNENIDLAVKRAAKTVFALKRYSHRDEKQVMIETDVLENVNTVLTIYDNKLKQINLEKYLSPVALTYAFQDELGQVWTNLIHNSLHAVGEKGTIKICVFEKDKHIHVSVEDSGYGIPKEIQEKIFTPFFTTKAQGEGSGLGLDIVLKIIKKHNGTITLQSEVGIGTKFTVVMPVLSEPLNQENE
jgi:two-component system NtrC family sensor kinase